MKEEAMNDRRAAISIIAGLALAVAACGDPAKSVVDKYFRAIQAQDNQTMASFAVVSFDKKVESWEVVQFHPEARSPATLPDLAAKVADLDAQLAENKKAYNAYFLDHPAEVDEVRELLREGKDIPKKLTEIAEDWQAFVDKEKELKKAFAEARDAVSKEKKNVSLSVGQLDNLDQLQGEAVSKNVDLTLTIAGQPQNYTMTLRKYELETEDTGARAMSRWVIFDLQPS
jgi:hypothetical protein